MNALLEKLKKNSSVKEAEILAKSKFFNDKDMVVTPIPALNVALSGRLDGGLTSGLTTVAGVSRVFKSGFCLVMAKAYMDKYPDSALLYFDSEFGTPRGYFETFNIDTSRVLHVPVTDIEMLKFDIMKQLEGINRGDRVIIVIDSVGNLASRKEVEDALDGKSVADMTRAKSLKSLFRMVTPHLNIKNIPMLVINHVYQELALYPRTILGGGTGNVYSSDTIFIVTRQQEKDGTDIAGYNFVITIDKSRFVREKSKIPINVMFEGGISKYSGLMDMALEAGVVQKPNQGWYSRMDFATGALEDKKWRMKDTNCKEFWDPILKSRTFQDWVKNNYQVASGSIMDDNDIDQAMNAVPVDVIGKV